MSEAQEKAVSEWMSGYRMAWESNAPADIAALFTENARYFTEPFSEPWVGRAEIIRNWIDRRDAPGSTSFAWTPLSITADVAIVTGETDYGTVVYSNLWVIRLTAAGAASEFTEWWMDQSKPSGEPSIDEATEDDTLETGFLDE
jgi:hypothetical protein